METLLTDLSPLWLIFWNVEFVELGMARYAAHGGYQVRQAGIRSVRAIRCAAFKLAAWTSRLRRACW